jgi:hypothetical protein
VDEGLLLLGSGSELANLNLLLRDLLRKGLNIPFSGFLLISDSGRLIINRLFQSMLVLPGGA